MRETDLLAFEIAVLEGQPGMVMCSYNKVNGDWACENDYLLNQLLKKTWGFKGVVVSDWNATHSTAKAALAGLDCEQPGGPPERARFGDALKKAVEAGEVPMSRIDDMVRRIVRTAFAAGVVDDPPLGRVVDPFKGADSAQRIAEQSSVLLKNANSAAAARCRAREVDRDHRLEGRHQRAVGRRVGPGRSSRRRPQPVRRSRRLVPQLAAQGHPRQGAEGKGRVPRWRRSSMRRRPWRRRPRWRSCSSTSRPAKVATWPR